MEPSPYGSPYPPDQPGWSPPPAAGPAAGTAPARARIGAVVLTAVVLELLIIGFAANQWATKQLLKINDNEGRLYAISWLSYNWRFSAQGSTQLWLAQLMLPVTTLVLTAALVWALLRGPVSWGRAFFGTWLAVLFATVVGAIVRGLIDPYARFNLPGASRVTGALLGPAGPNSGPVLAGLALGLVVALLTALVAVTSRRSAVAAAAPAGPPAFADYAAPPPSVPAALPPWQQEHAGQRAPFSFDKQPEAATTALPRIDEPARDEPARREEPVRGEEPTGALPVGDQPTTQLPPGEQRTTQPPPAGPAPAGPAPAGPPPAPPAGPSPAPPAGPPPAPPAGPPPAPPAGPPPAPPAGPPAGEQATTRFPRPPDDEELGHIDH